MESKENIQLDKIHKTLKEIFWAILMILGVLIGQFWKLIALVIVGNASKLCGVS